MQVLEVLKQAFKSCRKLSCRSSGHSTLQLELALMSLLQVISAVASEQGLPADKQVLMGAKMSQMAAHLLQESWQGAEDEAAEEDTKGVETGPFKC